MYGELTLREALAVGLLERFVRQEESRGSELTHGSQLERALALLVTQRRLADEWSALMLHGGGNRSIGLHERSARPKPTTRQSNLARVPWSMRSEKLRLAGNCRADPRSQGQNRSLSTHNSDSKRT